MTDIIDRAAKIERQHRDLAIAKARQASRANNFQHKDGDVIVCADCAEPIVLERLRIRPNATLCVECQSKREAQYGSY